MPPAAAADLRFTTHDEIKRIHNDLHNSFKSGVTMDVEFRKHQLKQLSFLLNDNAELIADAIGKDLGRCRFESLFAEIMLTTNSVLDALENCQSWSKPKTVWTGPILALHKPTIRKDPKGCVLVIGAWNYPISVQVGPMIGALAAGCTVVLKPSEVSGHSAKLLADLWPKYMDPRMSQVINGAIEETTTLLDLPWDHIMYTGNGRVGRIIAEKAAKWLCPTTLELGGKSPVIVDETADLTIAAHRILWAKSVNVGQTCIAPDYVLVTQRAQSKLLQEFKKAFNEFWPKGTRDSKDFARIVNDRQFARLANIVKNTKANVITGGQLEAAERYIDLTILADVQPGDAAMTEEIFGPILPVMTVADVDHAIDYINRNDRPLALYVFGSAKTVQLALERTRSGGVVEGDAMLHYTVEELPFGGTGGSGYGYYHGVAGFETFSHTRCSVHAPHSGVLGKVTEMLMKSRYAPYTDGNLAFLRRLLGKKPNFARPPKQYEAKSSSATSLLSFGKLSALFVAVVAFLLYAKNPQFRSQVQSRLAQLPKLTH